MKILNFTLLVFISGLINGIAAQVKVDAKKDSLKPGNMMAMKVDRLRASSFLKENSRLVHNVANIGDGQLSTAWVEGSKGHGLGQWIEFQIRTQQLCIANGFQKSNRLWRMNSRVKEFQVYFSNKYVGILRLQNSMGIQCADLSKLDSGIFQSGGGLPLVRLKIKSVYPGSHFKDTCISELWSQGG